VFHLPRKTQLPILAALLVLACDRDKRKKRTQDDTGQAADSGPDTEPDCDSGYLDDDGECVPAACGTGTWGNLELDESTVYVNIAAAEGGDGSEAAPFTSIQAGLDAAGDGTVALAAGTYTENLELSSVHAGLALRGRCAHLVSIDGSGGEKSSATVAVEGAASEAFAISGLTITGGRYAGLQLKSGDLAVEDATVTSNYRYGILAGDNASSGDAKLAMTRVAASRNLPLDEPVVTTWYGRGLQAQYGAEVRVVDSAIDENTGIGLMVYDAETSVSVEDSSVSATAADPSGYYGMGAEVHDATVSFTDCVVADNGFGGVAAEGGALHLSGVTLSGTQAGPEGAVGAILAWAGAEVALEGCTLSSNMDYGIWVGEGAEVSLTGVGISGTRVSGQVGFEHEGDTYAMAAAIMASDGGILHATDCTLQDNEVFGAMVMEVGTVVNLFDTDILDTITSEAQGGNIQWANAVAVTGGAVLTAEGGSWTDNAVTGLHVIEGGSFAELDGVTISGTFPTLNSSDGNSLGNGPGIVVSLGGGVLAKSCVLSENTRYAAASWGEGSSLTMEDCELSGTLSSAHDDSLSSGWGVLAMSGSALVLTDCELEDNPMIAVMVDGWGTTARLDGVTIASTRHAGDFYTVAAGVVSQNEATLTASNLQVSSTEGPALYVVGDETHATCSGCRFQDNQFAGAIVVDNATLDIADSLVENTSAQENIGGGVGIYADPLISGSPPALSVSTTTIRGNAVAGVWLTGQGSYSFSGNTIHGGEGWSRESLTKCGDAFYARDGVTAWDGSAGLLLEDNELKDSQGAGLFLDNATATLSGNSYADNAVDLVTQGADCGSAPDGFDDEALGSAELCPMYDYATCGDEFRLALELAEPKSGHGAALMRPGLPGPDEPHLPPLPVALPHTFDPLPLLPPVQRGGLPEVRLQPLRHEPAPPVPLVAPREH